MYILKKSIRYFCIVLIISISLWTNNIHAQDQASSSEEEMEQEQIQEEETGQPFQGYVYYAGEFSQIEGSASDISGADLKDETITSAGSRAGFELSWGNSWYQGISLDVYSSDSLLPTSLGNGEKEMSLSHITTIFGQPKDIALRISRTEFKAVGETTGSIPYYDDDRLMDTGEEFDLGIIIDTFYLVWQTGNIGMIDTQKSTEGTGFIYGIGIARMESLGGKEEYASSSDNSPERCEIDETLEGYGLGATIKLRYGTMILTDITNLYLQGNADVIAVTEVGGMLKGGYEVGLLIKPWENIVIRPYVGGYIWLLTSWGGYEFGGVTSDLGYSGGLQIAFRW